jgi:hypothetical protein
MIRPILEYGDVVWSVPGQIVDSLEKVQLNAARIVTGATARCPTHGLYNETCWETLADRRDMHRVTLFYKILNGKAPTYLRDLAPVQVHTRTNYNLRNSQNVVTQLTRIACLANSFFPNASHLWNELPQTIRDLPSVESFKRNHSNSLLKPNPLFYYGGRLEACIHARMHIKNSPLKQHLCETLNVINSPLCPCGTDQVESPKHYFF